MLYKISVNDLDMQITGTPSKFDDDTTLEEAADFLEDSDNLQRNPKKLEYWAITNHMKLNKDKSVPSIHCCVCLFQSACRVLPLF